MIARADPLRRRRSLLYVPAVNARAVDKARALPCDVVVLDLEDAVGPGAKEQARVRAVEIVRSGAFGPRETAVRCNGLDTPWGAADLKALTEAGAQIAVLPKIAGAAEVLAAEAMCGGALRLWAMIETCRAVIDLPAIAGAAGASRLEALMLGTNDLAAELRCQITPGREALSGALQSAVMAARAFGLLAFDGTFNDLADLEGLESQCRQGAALGFDGKTLIHPAQIEAANRAFSPSPERLAWARRVLAAYAAEPDAGVLKVDGRMTERLHLEEARRLMALAQS
ncbi:MAG TPA: CoA ester lyase [Caulobacteraceae bacterium]|nr:CoA ester lyase [Caulobacteraceae bacterium]